MESRLRLISTFILVFITVAKAQVTIQWEVTENTWGNTDQGSNVKLKCVAKRLPSLTLVTLRKTSVISERDYETVVTLQRVEDHLRNRMTSTGKQAYEVHYEAGGGDGTMELTINEIQPEDAGEYFCNVQVSENVNVATAKRKIIVNVPVMSVSMATVLDNGTLQTVPDDTTITLAEGTFGGVACVVALKSYYIKPEVTISGPDNSDIVFVNNTSPRFREGTETSPVFEHVLKYATSTPSYRLNGQVVKCEAFTEMFQDQQKRASALVIVEYKPVIRCQNDSKAFEGGTGRITCWVWSHPKISRVTVKFGFQPSENTFNIAVGTETRGKYTLTREDDNDKTTITFAIDSMTAVFFDGYSYQIEAVSNAYPPVTEEFKFTRGPVSKGPGFHASILTFAVAFILSTLR